MRFFYYFARSLFGLIALAFLWVAYQPGWFETILGTIGFVYMTREWLSIEPPP